MRHKLQRLAERRAHLVAQAAAQREALAQGIEPWRTPLALADQGLAAVRYLKRHPTWIIGAGVVLATLRPGNFGKWLRRGLLTWQVMHKLLGR